MYLDFAKAFDKVDHNLLLKKLRLYGFSEQIIKWIQSFLTKRTQSVVINGHHSLLMLIISGVPQGTVLGPIIFILFTNDLELQILFSKIGLFADDTRISKQIGSEDDVKFLQKDLDSALIWSKKNNMALHEDKFELLTHRSNIHNLLLDLPFYNDVNSYSVSSGKILYPADCLRDLGIAVSADLSWTVHISNITSKARETAAWMFSVFLARDKLTIMTLYKSLVRSLLEFCCPLWNPKKITDI